MPKYKSRDDVIARVSQLDTRTDTQARYAAHDEDEHVWALRKYVLEEIATFGGNPAEWPSVTLNGPRTYWSAVRRSVTASRPHIKVDLPPIGEGEEPLRKVLEETARHERFAMGILEENDEVRIRRGLQPLQLDMAWQMAIRGGSIARVWLDPNSSPQFNIALWDPRTVVYDPGDRGLDFAARRYYRPLTEIQQRYPKVDTSRLAADAFGRVMVYDCWWMDGNEAWNAVYTDGADLMEAEHMQDDHLPVFLVRAFGPDIDGAHDQTDQADRTTKEWESIYTANRETYKLLNRIATLYSLYLRRGAIGPYVGRIGVQSAEEATKALRPFGYTEMPTDGVVPQPVVPPQMAAEAKEFFGFLQGAEQRGSIPYSVYGQVQTQLSGFAINQLQGAVSIVSGQIANQMGWLYKLIIDEAFSQFGQRGKKLTVRGVDTRRRGYIEDMKRTDLRKKYFVRVDVTPEMPSDKLQDAQVAAQWAAIGIDPVTILDEVLKVDDPNQVVERMVAWLRLQQEVAAQNPVEAPANAAQQPGQPGAVPPTPSALTGMGEPAGPAAAVPAEQGIPA